MGIPDQFATAMGPQVHHWRPTTRHGHHITSDLLEHRAFTGLRTYLHPGHPFTAANFGNAAAKGHADACCLGRLHQCSATFGACIDDKRHIKTCLLQAKRSSISVIIICNNHRAISRRYREIHNIIAHSRSKHDARNIIASKRQRPFNSACGRHNLFAAHPPQSVARPPIAGCVIGDALIG